MKKTIIIILAIMAAIGLHAQQMPIIHSDGSVTFRLSAPGKDEVLLKGSFVPKKKTFNTPVGVFGSEGYYKMFLKDSLWTYTTGILPSDLYTYEYEVDEVDFPDPRNSRQVRDINTHWSYFIIPGQLGDMFIDQNVGHGKVEYVWYNSKIAETPRRRMAVYTPAGYDGSTALPVLYLLHGSGGDETAWLTLGRLAQIMDNMIAQKRCKPMIVVMPNGIADRAEAPKAGEKVKGSNPESMMGHIERYFVEDVVGYVESHYNVIRQKSGRAIAGLSLGGLHTMYTSANNPKTFDYVGLFSAQTTNALTDKRINTMQKWNGTYKKVSAKVSSIFKILSNQDHADEDSILARQGTRDLDIYENIDAKLKAQFADKPKLYYIAIGRDDFLKKLNDDLRQKLTDAGYKYTYNETDGAHTWSNWRKYLIDFLPRLF